MPPIEEPPFTDVNDVTGVVDATAQTEIATMFTSLLAHIPTGAGSQPAPMPDFDFIPPSHAEKLRVEINAIAAAIAAAPAV